MIDTSTQVLSIQSFQLAGGAVLPQADIAYVTLGKLNEEGTNAILVTHGYTSSHRFVLAEDNAPEGSWSGLVGPGKAIDTDRFFVVCSNALGSCYGSTGPASIDPETGLAYGSHFPQIGFEDVVRLQRALLDSLGIGQLHAVVGVSMGGYQALQWAVQYPGFAARVGVVLSALQASADSNERLKDLREAVRSQPGWNDGRPAQEAMEPFLARLRYDTLKNYGFLAWCRSKGMDDAEQTRVAQGLANQWASVFDVNSLITLRQAIASFDVTDQLSVIRSRVLYVLSTTDRLFPPSLAPDAMKRFTDAKVDAQYVELESDFGHLASGLDWQKWAPALKAFLQS